MAIYAVGDIQGCLAPLEKLLRRIKFKPPRDQIWFCGDLVNRGPQSLETLRFIKSLGDSAIAVLGNHDLHLLAVAAGVRELRPPDTMRPILAATDRDELLHWLRGRPLLHIGKSKQLTRPTLLSHAGIYPGWRRKQAVKLAREVETLLRGPQYSRLLRAMYAGEPVVAWEDDLEHWRRIRFIVDAFTRMRYCDRRGRLDFINKDTPGKQPKNLMPWFEHPDLRCKKWRIIFGHWSALNYQRAGAGGRVICLDSGCVWGHALTAIRLDGPPNENYWQARC